MAVVMTLVRAKVRAVTALVSVLAVGCTRATSGSSPVPPRGARPILDEYEVTVGPGYDLAVSAAFDGPVLGPLAVDAEAMDFVDRVAEVRGASRHPLARGVHGY